MYECTRCVLCYYAPLIDVHALLPGSSVPKLLSFVIFCVVGVLWLQ